MSSYLGFSAREKVQYSPEASEVLGKDYWLVLESFDFYLGEKGGRIATVPAGFLTDGASVPRLLWAAIPPWGPWGQAVILHDWLVENLFVTLDGVKILITRSQADDIFLEALEVLKVPFKTRRAMYRAVQAYTRVIDPTKPSGTERKRAVEQALMRML